MNFYCVSLKVADMKIHILFGLISLNNPFNSFSSHSNSAYRMIKSASSSKYISASGIASLDASIKVRFAA